MSDELVTVPPADGSKRLRPHLEIKRRVAEALASSGPQLLKAVETALVDVEQEKRKGAILKMIEKISAADKELKKLETQGVQSFNLANEPVGPPVFTKQQMGDLKSKREELQKLDNALATALEKLDFQKLFELIGENKQQG